MSKDTPGVTIVQTGTDLKDGQNKCPACGGTDIALNIDTGGLRCNNCRHETAPVLFAKSVTDISSLEGTVIGSGAANIEASAEEVHTFKCSSCGAEVIVDTTESLQARCHWCRNTLSINQQIPNGAVPDKVLPFSVKRDNARDAIAKFVGERQFFAHPVFKREFTAENVMGVYLPYMVIDINSNASLSGQGETEVSSYTIDKTTYYNVDLYDVSRKFDLVVENLTIEADSDKLQHGSSNRTNNIVNAIKPYDTENCLRWNANYMRGFTSQKRDTNVQDLTGLLETKVRDIARHKAQETTEQYDRGVRWDDEELDVKGSQWKAAYLPIWLYSYQHKNVIHYVASNGRNLNTMGSVPINMLRLWICTIIAQIVGMISGTALVGFLAAQGFDEGSLIGFALYAAGPAFYWLIYSRYRNKEARYRHESHESTLMENLEEEDTFVEHVKGTTRSFVEGRNDEDIEYEGEDGYDDDSDDYDDGGDFDFDD